MVDDIRDEPGRRASNGDRLTRAFSAPARAMSRLVSGIGLGADEAAAIPLQPGGRRDAIVDCAIYEQGRRLPSTGDYREALAQAKRTPGAFVWLGLHAPDAEQMAGIAEAYDLHELAVEDVVSAGQRPKLEQFGDVHFLVLRTARYVEHKELTDTSEVVETGQIMLFIGPDFVISVRHGNACRLRPVRELLESRPELLRQGPWAVAYGVLDHVVDLYVLAADGIGQDVDVLEEAVFSRDSSGRMQRIYQLKRELVEFKRAALPLQRPLQAMLSDTPEITKELRKYFRDVQDHLARVVEQVGGYDDLLISIMQARLAQVSVDQNNDMRKIAAYAGMAAAWTAITGVYGMNFEYMPELHMRYGYPVTMAFALAVSYGIYRSFRRSGWL
ncbi:magnesium transporter CorA [Catellatospora sp. TT07R-123]|uniref:magnesium and cobalt transport protein CorA n=1 Tax=Catellatospora sp. TT07R-123 TaxID=2733863 RepID=UPI001B0EDFBD|nr:magnesium transporter CorA [Catellatospora sp. TT07R-123]